MELFKDEPSLQQQSENVISFELEVQTHKVKVFVMIEKRRGSRISFTKKGIVIRLSQSLTQQQKQEQSSAFLSWAKNKIAKHPELITQYNFGKTYQDGDWLKLYDENFLIKVQTNQTKFATVKVREGELVLIFPENSKPERRHKVASKLVAKIMANYFQPKVNKRIQEINQAHFQKKISKVTLKNNSSNWGSCSIRHNINISTRLLFAPAFVIDYVFIHELTHLVHMDHSDRFWAHVQGIMPDYEKAEIWLKKNGNSCIF